MPRFPRKLSASAAGSLRREMERTRWANPKRARILAALADHHGRGLSLDAVASAHGVSRRAVANASRAFRDEGVSGLAVKAPGKKPALAPESFRAL